MSSSSSMSTKNCKKYLPLPTPPHPVPPNLFKHICTSHIPSFWFHIPVLILCFYPCLLWQFLNFTFNVLFIYFIYTDCPTWLLVLPAASFWYFILLPKMRECPLTPHHTHLDSSLQIQTGIIYMSCSLGNDLTVKSDLSLPWVKQAFSECWVNSIPWSYFSTGIDSSSSNYAKLSSTFLHLHSSTFSVHPPGTVSFLPSSSLCLQPLFQQCWAIVTTSNVLP